jgi:hypothetical protein
VPDIARALSAQGTASTMLTYGWGRPLAGPWEAWMDPPLAPRSALNLPHCLNAGDTCDPDTSAHRARFWYRRHLAIDNPCAGGRTLLYFEEAGVDARNVVGFTLAGTGSLIDNQGTSTGSRVVQLSNGRVQISVADWGAGTIVGLHADGVPSALCPLGAPPALTPR